MMYSYFYEHYYRMSNYSTVSGPAQYNTVRRSTTQYNTALAQTTGTNVLFDPSQAFEECGPNWLSLLLESTQALIWRLPARFSHMHSLHSTRTLTEGLLFEYC